MSAAPASVWDLLLYSYLNRPGQQSPVKPPILNCRSAVVEAYHGRPRRLERENPTDLLPKQGLRLTFSDRPEGGLGQATVFPNAQPRIQRLDFRLRRVET